MKKTNSYFRGHNFVWDQQTPAYVTNITDPAELKAVLKEHIDAVMGRYGEYFYAFDVVNERESDSVAIHSVLTDAGPFTTYPAFNENGTVKSSVWFDVLGESYIETAVSQVEGGKKHGNRVAHFHSSSPTLMLQLQM